MAEFDDLKEVVNKSGFPLQLAIEHNINDGTGKHGWKVQYSEHAWNNTEDDTSGFIDLVLENKPRNLALVIECKRVLDTSWVFLNPNPKIMQRRYARVWRSSYEGGTIAEFDWYDFPLDPASAQSEFCVMRGQGSNEARTLLEKTAANLVSSTEALAKEELISLMSETCPLRCYLNVIVTTADLYVCNFDASTISLENGTLTDCTFERVPLVRFHKQLSTRSPNSIAFQVGDTTAMVHAKENTIFVVNASYLETFIQTVDF